MRKEEMVYIRCGIATNKVGSGCEDVYEYPKKDWDALTPEEKTALLDDFYDDHFGSYANSWRVAEDAEGNEISGDL